MIPVFLIIETMLLHTALKVETRVVGTTPPLQWLPLPLLLLEILRMPAYRAMPQRHLAGGMNLQSMNQTTSSEKGTQDTKTPNTVQSGPRWTMKIK
jgi:hypothetical protein